jgi:hypothetical protein
VVPVASAKTADVEITARLIIDKAALLKLVGSDLKLQYALVDLTVVPRGGYPVTISRDDFLLRSERDNERATPDSPDRIAGSAVLVLGSTGGGRSVYSQSGDPVYVGGIPGVGTGPPRRVGTQDDAYGSGAASGETKVTPGKAEAGPLVDALREKELKFGEIHKPLSGYLYFPIDPKQKAKNFHLHYKGPAGSCEMRFK